MEPLRVLVMETTGAITSRVTAFLGHGFEVQLLGPRKKLADTVRTASPALVLIELTEVTTDLIRAVETVMAECPARSFDPLEVRARVGG